MSYDIFVQDLPPGITSVADIPDDFRPAPIGPRQAIVDGILGVFAAADFSDPHWGRIETETWSIEVNISPNDPCTGFALHVRGDTAAIGAVATLLERLGLRALDASEGGLFSADTASIERFREWRSWRDEIVAGSESSRGRR